MKAIISSKLALICLFFSIPLISSAATYYSKSSGFANLLTNWGRNTDGTGTQPPSFLVSGDIFILRSGVTMNLSGNWTIGAGVTLQVDGNISVTNNNHDITISGTVIFTNPSATQVSLTGGGNGNSFTLSANATIKTANQNGLRGANASLPATASGNINLNANATYEFIGSADQLTTGLPANVKDLVANNGAKTSVSSNTTITGQLRLQNGIVDVNAGLTLTIPSPSAIVGSGFGVNKHIRTRTSGANKSFIRVNNLSGTVTIPTGDGTNYLPVTITSASTTSVQVSVFTGLTYNGLPNGSALSNSDKLNAVDAVYTLQRMSGSGSFDLTLGWPSSLEGSQFSNLLNNEIGIAINNGSTWGTPLGTGNQAANTATITGLSTMGTYAVGKIGIPLYVKFGSINAILKNNAVSLKWETLTEVDLRKFVIERSADGIQFSSIGDQTALAANYTGHQYIFNDASPLTGVSFYRILAEDLDGKLSYSAVIRISNQSAIDASLKLYPNPVINKEINLQLSAFNPGNYQLQVMDMNGKLVFSEQFQVSSAAVSLHLVLPATIARGNHMLILSSNGKRTAQLFSVQ